MPKPDTSLLLPSRYAFRAEVTPRYSDLDPNGHINNLALAQAIEDGRVRMYAQLGRPLGSGLVVVSLTVDFLAEATHGDALHIHSGIAAIGRSSWTVGQLALQAGRPVAYATSVMLLMVDGAPALTSDWRGLLETNLIRPAS